MSAQPQSVVTSIDAPVEGWNAFDSLDSMPPTAAIVLNNIIPGAGKCVTRQGHIIYADLGTGLPVETVASMNSATMSQLIAASGGGVWEVDDTAVEVKAFAVTELAPAGTFTNSRWQTENFRKADEAGVMVMCNGVDTAQVYDGATLTPLTTAGSDPAVTPDFIGCIAFKGRMYYWKDNDNAFYYAQAGSYQGALEKFDLGSFVQQGGKLVTVFSWTQQDSGHGRDDFIVFVFSTGEILVYQGDDPETVGYFEQVGRYLTAEPLSIRGYTQYGADTILMTKDGYVSMTSIIQEGRTSDVPQFSRLIHAAVTARTRGVSLWGWDVELYPRDGLLVFNVPISNVSYEQHVMNTVTQKWCRFNSLDTNCLEVHDERLFGGMGDGTIIAMLETTADNGNPISFDCLYAFSYLDNPGYHKMMSAAQVLTTHSNPQDIQLSGYADFNVPLLTPIPLPIGKSPSSWAINPAAPPSEIGSFWATSNQSAQGDYWSSEGNAVTTKGWQNISAYGYAIALLVRFAKVNESVEWTSTTLRFHMMGAQ